MKTKNYRQGDVLLIAQTSLPQDAKRIKPKPLAYGEITGHKHEAVSSSHVEHWEHDGHHYIEVTSNVVIAHGNETQINRIKKGELLDCAVEQIHAPISIEPGIYEVRPQREYEPNGWRNVAD